MHMIRGGEDYGAGREGITGGGQGRERGKHINLVLL